MRYDSKHKLRTRDRVLKEAAAAIRTEGAAGIGVAAIMARAGLTQGGFYAHFKSKDDLVAQAIETMFAERYASLFDGRATPDPAAALATFIAGYLSTRHRDAPEQGCPIPALAAELPRLSDDARARFAHGATQLIDAIASLIGKLNGKEAAAAHQLASSVVGEMVGALSIARACRDSALSDAILAASRATISQRLAIPIASPTDTGSTPT